MQLTSNRRLFHSAGRTWWAVRYSGREPYPTARLVFGYLVLFVAVAVIAIAIALA